MLWIDWSKSTVRVKIKSTLFGVGFVESQYDPEIRYFIHFFRNIDICMAIKTTGLSQFYFFSASLFAVWTISTPAVWYVVPNCKKKKKKKKNWINKRPVTVSYIDICSRLPEHFFIDFVSGTIHYTCISFLEEQNYPFCTKSVIRWSNTVFKCLYLIHYLLFIL